MKNDQIKNILLLLVLGCCWGPSFLFIKVAIEYIPPITVGTLRVGIAGVLLYIFLKARKIDLPKFGKAWKHFAVMGFFSCGLPFVLFPIGESYVDSSFAAILNGTTPLFTMMIAHFFTEKDRLSKEKILGAIIGLCGLVVLVAPALITAKASVGGVVALLVAALCYGIGLVYAKKHVQSVKPIVTTASQLLMATLFLSPFALMENHGSLQEIPLSAILSVFGLAIFGTVFAFILFFKLIAETSATYASTVTYISPVFGMILGVVVLDEKLYWNSYVGIALILVGVMIANGIVKNSNFCRKFLR